MPGAQNLREGVTTRKRRPKRHSREARMGEDAPATGLGEAIDWLGRPVSCKDCPHQSMRDEGRCDLGRICVRDRRSKRIDRFFANIPALAARYLEHPYFELRVLAAKHANVFLLPPLLTDTEADVRAMAVYRLPGNRVSALKTDPDRKVRLAVAQRLEGAGLVSMLEDKDYAVRRTVVRRLPEDLLVLAMNDPEPEVRRLVASRIPVAKLTPMMFDTDPLVRMYVAQRLEPHQLAILVHDEDLRVRFIVAERGNADALTYLRYDRDPEVKAKALSRLQPECDSGGGDGIGS